MPTHNSPRTSLPVTQIPGIGNTVYISAMHSRIMHRQDLNVSESVIVGTLTQSGDSIYTSSTAGVRPLAIDEVPALATLSTFTIPSTANVPTSTITSVPPPVATKAASRNIVLPILATLDGFIFLAALYILFVVCKGIYARRMSSAAAPSQSYTINVESPSDADAFPESAPPSYQPTTEKNLESGFRGPLEHDHTLGLDPSHNTSSLDVERTRVDIPASVSEMPPRYAMEPEHPGVTLGERRRGKRVARDGGVLLDQGPGAEEMRRQRSVSTVRTEFSVGTVPSTSASTLPPPYGRYD